MKKNILSVVASASLIALSGCASVMTHEEQTVNVKSSTNQPVEVSIEGQKVTTPGTVVLLRDGKDKVVRTADGSCEKETAVDKTITPVFFGNIILGGFPGSTTDAVTGKMWDYEDDVVVTCK